LWLVKIRLSEMFNEVGVGRHLSDTLPLQNDLSNGDTLGQLLF